MYFLPTALAKPVTPDAEAEVSLEGLTTRICQAVFNAVVSAGVFTNSTLVCERINLIWVSATGLCFNFGVILFSSGHQFSIVLLCGEGLLEAHSIVLSVCFWVLCCYYFSFGSLQLEATF